jgi:hypothetical protein
MVTYADKTNLSHIQLKSIISINKIESFTDDVCCINANDICSFNLDNAVENYFAKHQFNVTFSK